jgi:hypothetical protein
MPIQILRPPPSAWGDYGDILMHGMALHLDRTSDGRLQLERTGPFIPPVSFPGGLVVTDAFRHQLELSGLTGFGFRPVVLARIVRLEWEKWDRTVPEPAEYPESGEPEDYILERPHDPALARGLGPLWEVVFESGLATRRPRPIVKHQREIEVLVDSWSGADLCSATGVGFIYASDRAQEWLRGEATEHVVFEDCTLVHGAA